MPKIPRNRQSQVLRQGNPTQAVSVSGGASSQAVDQLGNALVNLGGTVEQYEKEKNRIEESQFRAQARAESQLEYIKAEKSARENPNGNPDGSTLLKDFSDASSGVADRINSLDKDNFKQIAIEEANNAMIPHLKTLGELSTLKFNQNILTNVERRTAVQSLILQENPERLGSELALNDKANSELPQLAGNNLQKIEQVTGKDLVLSAVSGFSNLGQFDVLKKEMRKPEVVKYLGNDVAAVNNAIRNAETAFMSRKNARETLRLNQLKRQQEAQTKNVISVLVTQISEADTPEKMLAANEAINNAVKFSYIPFSVANAIRSSDKNRSDEIDRIIGEALDYAANAGDSADQMRNNIHAAQMNGYSSKASSKRLNSINDDEAKAKQDPAYKLELQAANEELKDAVPKSNRRDRYGNRTRTEGNQLLQSRIETAYRTFKMDGMRPREALRRAKGQELGYAKTIDIPGIPQFILDSPDRMQAEIVATQLRYKAIKESGRELSRRDKAAMGNRTRLLEMRIKAFAADKDHNELLKTRQEDPKKKEK